MNAATAAVTMKSVSTKERGIREFARGAWASALAAFDQAAEEPGRDSEIHNYRARALDALGRPLEALQAIEAALVIAPNNVADLKNKANLLRRLGRFSEALASLEAVLRGHPRDLDALIKRVHALVDLERRDEALGCIEELLKMRPREPLALNARGIVLERLGRYQDALDDFEQILAQDPTNADALNNRGMIHARRGQWTDALTAYTQSLTLRPDQPQAFYNRSLVRLALGDWEEGLREFDSRWDAQPLKSVRPNLPTPQWTGREGLQGKTVFVYHEQGFGDTLQCARYVPLLAERGARVVFAVPANMRRLMESLNGSPKVIAIGDTVPEHDFHCPLMSLMGAFGTTRETVPKAAEYLKSDPAITRRWAQRLSHWTRPRIGIAWSGRAYPPVNYVRDVPLSELNDIFDLDADWISLQFDLSSDDRAKLTGDSRFDWQSILEAKDFSDTAGLMSCLDLVISADTAIAHLAGALGKPIWLMNRFASCWRWGQEGSKSAWYSSMRIFRQPALEDWTSVVERVRVAADHFIEGVESDARRSRPAIRRTFASERSESQRETIRFVCATRCTGEDFLAQTPLGRSLPLYRTFPRGRRIELRLFKENAEGLSSVYNTAIEEARSDPAILVFIHDDVHLSDYHWADHLVEGLTEFDIVGLAGNRRRARGQASWMYLDDSFQRDQDENLSGVLGHGEGFPNLRQLSIYGEPRSECKLLDGVLLAVRSETLLEHGLRFDPRFTFHFYDLDFCRQAEQMGLRMGTWALSIIHASAGKLGTDAWRAAYKTYLEKYGELGVSPSQAAG